MGKVPLGNMPTIETPFLRVAIDATGPLGPTSRDGHCYVLTIFDIAARYPDAVALRSCRAQEIAEELVEMFSRCGIPREIVSDRSTSFTFELMKEVSQLLSIKPLLTTPCHSMCTGLVEWFNGTIKQIIMKMCQEQPVDWYR